MTTHFARSLIKETSNTTGTGDYTLLGASGNFQPFHSSDIVAGINTYVPYMATMGVDYEYGIGRLSASSTLQRVKVIESSAAADAAVNWSAGTKTIICARGGQGEFTGRHNFAAATAVPTISDNYTQGYGPGSLWMEYSGTGQSPAYICLFPGYSAFPDAIWVPIGAKAGITFPSIHVDGPQSYTTAGAVCLGNPFGVWSGDYSADEAVGLGLLPLIVWPQSVVHGFDDPARNYTEAGTAQHIILPFTLQTTNATPVNLEIYGTASIKAKILPATTLRIKGQISARKPSNGDSSIWDIDLCVQRIGSGNPALIGSVAKTVAFASAGASTWDVAINTNNTDKSFEVNVTGQAASTINWVARFDILQNSDGLAP